jgi:hypothetical protein
MYILFAAQVVPKPKASLIWHISSIMNYFRVENLGKSYAGKLLLGDISLGFGQGIKLPPGNAPRSKSEAN